MCVRCKCVRVVKLGERAGNRTWRLCSCILIIQCQLCCCLGLLLLLLFGWEWGILTPVYWQHQPRSWRDEVGPLQIGVFLDRVAQCWSSVVYGNACTNCVKKVGHYAEEDVYPYVLVALTVFEHSWSCCLWPRGSDSFANVVVTVCHSWSCCLCSRGGEVPRAESQRAGERLRRGRHSVPAQRVLHLHPGPVRGPGPWGHGHRKPHRHYQHRTEVSLTPLYPAHG